MTILEQLDYLVLDKREESKQATKSWEKWFLFGKAQGFEVAATIIRKNMDSEGNMK